MKCEIRAIYCALSRTAYKFAYYKQSDTDTDPDPDPDPEKSGSLKREND
jgi:hypothetical protein